ncbi:hypothetical protein RF11_02463 [Thelohanellus kitauei]|uniref:Uncharacterized protein n=1 Tax=Thelohanellus kitauei TaxID=669202 RepID=A0A0C2M4B6_THEKT|nr:hypothetical protein RF11_02463 [Thelohanellus kitauei]
MSNHYKKSKTIFIERCSKQFSAIEITFMIQEISIDPVIETGCRSLGYRTACTEKTCQYIFKKAPLNINDENYIYVILFPDFFPEIYRWTPWKYNPGEATNDKIVTKLFSRFSNRNAGTEERTTAVLAIPEASKKVLFELTHLSSNTLKRFANDLLRSSNKELFYVSKNLTRMLNKRIPNMVENRNRNFID